MKFATLLMPSRVYMSTTPFQSYHNVPNDPKEIEYNLHYGEVRGDVLRPPHATNASCNSEKIKVKKRLPLETKNTLQSENGILSYTETLYKQ